jgi:hypothetical protein
VNSTLITPNLITITTPSYQADLTTYPLLPTTHHFALSWQGLPAAAGTVVIAPLEEAQEHAAPPAAPTTTALRITVAVRTIAAISVMYPAHLSALALVNASTLAPLLFRTDLTVGSERSICSLEFGDSYGALTLSTGKGTSHGAATAFNTANPTLDPITAALLVRSLPWKDGQERSFDVIAAERRFHVVVRSGAPKRLRVNGVERDVLPLYPLVRELTCEKPALKILQTTLLISNDALRQPLLLECQTARGKLSCSLTPNATCEGAEPAASFGQNAA